MFPEYPSQNRRPRQIPLGSTNKSLCVIGCPREQWFAERDMDVRIKDAIAPHCRSNGAIGAHGNAAHSYAGEFSGQVHQLGHVDTHNLRTRPRRGQA